MPVTPANKERVKSIMDELSEKEKFNLARAIRCEIFGPQLPPPSVFDLAAMDVLYGEKSLLPKRGK